VRATAKQPTKTPDIVGSNWKVLSRKKANRSAGIPAREFLKILVGVGGLAVAKRRSPTLSLRGMKPRGV